MTTKLEHTGGEWHVHPQAPNEIWATRGPIAMTVARTDNDSSPAYDFEEEGNAHLLALAKTAPHECSDPECPGDLNRRMLEAHDALRASHKRLLEACLDADCFGPNGDDCKCGYCGILESSGAEHDKKCMIPRIRAAIAEAERVTR